MVDWNSMNNWMVDILSEVAKDIDDDESLNLEDSNDPIGDLRKEVIKRVLDNETFKANRKKTVCAEDLWCLFFYSHACGG